MYKRNKTGPRTVPWGTPDDTADQSEDVPFTTFPTQKSKIELKIAMKTWDILKATYLIALLYISNENMLEMSSYIKSFHTCYKALRGVCLTGLNNKHMKSLAIQASDCQDLLAQLQRVLAWSKLKEVNSNSDSCVSTGILHY